MRAASRASSESTLRWRFGIFAITFKRGRLRSSTGSIPNAIAKHTRRSSIVAAPGMLTARSPFFFFAAIAAPPMRYQARITACRTQVKRVVFDSLSMALFQHDARHADDVARGREDVSARRLLDHELLRLQGGDGDAETPRARRAQIDPAADVPRGSTVVQERFSRMERIGLSPC